MQSPPFPRYLVPPRSKYSPQHHVLKHPQLPFLPQYQRPSFTPMYVIHWCKFRVSKKAHPTIPVAMMAHHTQTYQHVMTFCGLTWETFYSESLRTQWNETNLHHWTECVSPALHPKNIAIHKFQSYFIIFVPKLADHSCLMLMVMQQL